MRFCMVTTFYPPYHFGGDALYVRALSRALVARGHEVEVIHCIDAFWAAGGRHVAAPTPVNDGITVHRLKSRLGIVSPLVTQQTGWPGLKAAALRRLLSGNFDVVNFHNISLVGGPGVIGYSQAPVTVYTLHEHWLLCPTHIFWKNRSVACDGRTCFSCSIRSGIPPQLWRYTNFIRNAVAKVDMLIAPSEFTANQHREPSLPTPVSVLPLFSDIDVDAFEQKQVTDRPVFVYVGRVTGSKGIVPLLKAFSAHPSYDLEVIGDGDLLERLRSAYGQAPNIRFLGRMPQQQLIGRYRNARALVFPSLAPETFGLSIVEAFATGTPAIVHDAGGCREAVDATGGGFVYRTEAELVSALHCMAGDDESWQEMCVRAFDGYRRLYTRKHHVSSYLDLVQSLGNR